MSIPPQQGNPVNEPFIRLARKFFRHWMWGEHRTFSRAEAWLDLIRLASFKPDTTISQGRLIHIARGELVGSYRFLASRWKWSKTKVERFISVLKREEMLCTRSEAGTELLSLCNYDLYNEARDNNEDANKDSDKDSDEDSLGTPTRTKLKKVLRSKEGKDEKKYNPPTFPAGLGTPEFLEVWEEFRTHRKAKRAKMTPFAEKLILETLAEQPARAVEAVKTAIQRNWTGFKWDWLEPKFSNQSPAKASERRENITLPIFDPMSAENQKES